MFLLFIHQVSVGLAQHLEGVGRLWVGALIGMHRKRGLAVRPRDLLGVHIEAEAQGLVWVELECAKNAHHLVGPDERAQSASKRASVGAHGRQNRWRTVYRVWAHG